jgi:hypothetical protein
MKTCVERCALEFEGNLEGIFGRVVTRAECERMALDCDPCNPESCAVTRVLKKQPNDLGPVDFRDASRSRAVRILELDPMRRPPRTVIGPASSSWPL